VNDQGLAATMWPHDGYPDYGDMSYPTWPVPGILNKDGSISTERSITMDVPGVGWVNMPSIYFGRKLTPEQSVDYYLRGMFTNAFGPFTSLQDAESAAELRSRMGGLFAPF
jgi:hypothetical protein